MAFMILAYDSSIAAGTVLVNCNSILDAGNATQSGSGYVIDKRMKVLLGAFAFGANLTRAQIQAPRFNLLAYQELMPLAQAAAAAAGYPQFNDWIPGPRQLNETEVLGAQVIQSGGVAENDRVIVMIGDGPPAPVTKEYFTIRFTAAATLTVDAWTNATITLDRNLPKGHYQVIGARAKTAGGIAFRLAFTGGLFRPGFVCSQSDLSMDHRLQRAGRLGVWGEFDQNLLPTVDFLSSSADTAQSGELDLVLAG